MHEYIPNVVRHFNNLKRNYRGRIIALARPGQNVAVALEACEETPVTPQRRRGRSADMRAKLDRLQHERTSRIKRELDELKPRIWRGNN